MRRKKIIIALSSLLALAVLAVALAPTLLSGYVRGKVEQEVGARVNGTVALQSVELGWFSPQRIEGLSIDGGAEVGKVSLTAEVAEGLAALLRGSDISLTLGGGVQTAFDAEGRIGLAKLAKAAEPGGQAAGGAAGEGAAGTPLGTRKLQITLAGLELSAKGPDGAEYALRKIDGDITLAGSALKVAVDAATHATGKDGELSIDADAQLAFAPAGGVDAAATSGNAKISASSLAWPTAAGELTVSSLRLDLAKSAQGDVGLKADAIARVAGSSEATVRADVSIAAPFDASGRFTLDPSGVSATVDARGVPMGALQAFAPEIKPGVRVDFAKDIGETANLTIAKQRGDRARINLESKQVEFAFDGTVAADGSSIDGGTVMSRASVRPELLRALGLLEANALEVTLRGERIAWKKGDDAVRSFGGSFGVDLARPFDFQLDGVPARVRAESLRVDLDKKLGEVAAHAAVSAKGRYGAAGDAVLSASADLDLASRALLAGAIDASARIDSAFVERMTDGAVSARGQDASVKLSVPELAYIPSADYSGIRALVARARLELSGALAVEGAGTTAAVNDLSIDLSTPRGAKPGSLALGAKVDGAEVRVSQQFGPIPAGPMDLVALAPSGEIAVAGLDPSFISRLAPAAAKSIGVLGRGKMRLDARNRTERGAILADFTLDAAAVDASGSVSYQPTAISASNLAVDATLTREAIASLDLGEGTELEPGARISLRAPVFALARKAEAWEPAGDLALRAIVEDLRVRRAPGIVAPLAVQRIDATASYAFADARATANGKAALGTAAQGGGDLDFRISWRKPAEAKLFAGAEGSLDLTNFDLARFEPCLGLEPGAYSGILGGAGSLRVAFSENGAPAGTVALEFPRARGSLALSAPLAAGVRTARVSGTVGADIAADAFARLAGLARDPSRRVTQPVSVELAIASASVPLDDAMKPQLAAAAVDASGSLSAVSIETSDAAGRKMTISTGALALTVKSARLADEIAVRITGKDATAAALDVDAKVKGAVAAKPDAKPDPTIDATVRATKFPAATVDALAGTGGAVGRYLGDAIDAQVDARNLSASGGALAAKFSSEFASLDAPALTVADGMLRVAADKPLTATFSLSPAVREQLLSSIHPVFSDVTTGAPAKFTLPTLAWPLDGDRKRLDAAFTLETGELKLVNSGAVTWMLALASAGRTDGFDAYLEPLRANISKGRLTYSDFTLRAGKTAQGSWRNSLVFAGDIDLAAKPIRANSISTSIPLSDAANWSADARGLFESLSAASPELVKRLTVGVEIKGPLFDPAGKPVKPDPKLKLPDVGDVLRDNPGAVLDAAGGILDIINKPKQPKPPKQPKKKQQQEQPPASDPPAAPPQA